MSVLLKVLAGSSLLASASAMAGVAYVLKHMDEMPEEIQEQYQMFVNKLNGRGWDKEKVNMFILGLAFFTWPIAIVNAERDKRLNK